MISRVDAAVAGVLSLRIARMHVDHGGARLVAARGGLADLLGLLRNDRAVAVLLHAAIDRDRDDDLVSGEHCVSPDALASVQFSAVRSRLQSSHGRTMPAKKRAGAWSQPGIRVGGGTMSDIRQITEWRASTAIGRCIRAAAGAIGTEEFGPRCAIPCCRVIAGARRIYLFEATGREDTSLQYFFGEPGLVDLFPAYRKWYLRQDPVCDAYRAAPECSNVVLQRVRPAHIASPGFRRRIFDDAGIVERISVIQRGADAWRVINVARHASDGCCTDGEIDALIGLACLVLPMLPLNRNGARRAAHYGAQLEERFASRFARLTRRERQVCARAAIGMSVEATALDLGIGTDLRADIPAARVSTTGRDEPFELCALVTH